MAKGKPSKWITAKIDREFDIGKTGIQIVVWNKYGRSKKGICYLTVGGIWWKPHNKKTWIKKSWNSFEAVMNKK